MIDGKLQLKPASAAKKKGHEQEYKTDQQKAYKQGRDDSIKQFSNNPTLHIFNSGKICRVELCTELFYAIIPTLFLCFFADLLSLHLVTFFYTC